MLVPSRSAARYSLGHAGQIYELTGPRLMTFGDTAEELSKATGREIRYVPLTREEYLDEQREQGVPEEWARLSAELYESVRSEAHFSLTAHVRRVLDRSPRDFSEYVTAAAARGVWRN